MLSILDIVEDTTVDGPGFRTSIYAAGCPNACPGCHNPQSWDMANGHLMSVDEVLSVVLSNPFSDVTFTGGDPLFQAEVFAELASSIKSNSTKTIWCFTGFTFEELLSNPKQRRLLELLDVLVDGKYIERLRDEQLLFRGSANQRIIDVRASLAANETVRIEASLLKCNQAF